MTHLRSLLAALFAGMALVQAAFAAPDTLTQTVTYSGQTITMRLTRQDLRGPHFQLRAQNSTGAYDTITPVPERSYLGTVDEFPDAVASGILKDNGVFRGAVYFDRGATWFTTGSAVDYTRGTSQPSSFGVPGFGPSSGEAGTTMYGFGVGIDADYEYYSVRSGSSIAKAFEHIEFSVAATRAMYMTNLLARPYLSRVIIRTSQTQDPANGKQGGVYLDAVRTHWNNNQADSVRQVVAGVSASDVGGGLAWVGVIGTSSAYSVNDSGGDGEFTIVWRHELGHNWGLSHYDGGSPEGSTINSNNQFARMSGPELDKALNHRNSRLNIFTNGGTYSAVDLPPYATIDSGSMSNGSFGEAVLDVLPNDHDANADSLSLLANAATSVQSGKIVRQGNKLIYFPRGDFLGTDSFTYKIQDSSGQTATGAVAVSVQPNDRLRLYLPLNETTGTSAADQSVFNRDGTLEGTDFATSTVAGKFGNAVDFDGSDDSVYSGGVSLKSSTVTLCGWIKREATQINYAGIIFDRSSTVSGINIGSDGKLRYHWNDAQYGWNSNLTPPVGVWTFVALVVEPARATMYMNSGSGFTSAVNTATHGSATFGTVHVGMDPSNSRNFAGVIDDARVYGAALSQAELQKVADGTVAEGPNPFDGAREVAEVDLDWAQAPAAVKYHVYLGTSEAAVAAATLASPEYLGETTSSSFLSPQLSPSVTYWWRVDVETATATIPGAVWEFTRNNKAAIDITNHSFEDGATGAGTPPGWSLTAGSAANLGVSSGGSEGAKYLYIGPGVTITQDLTHTLISGEALTLTYQSARDYTRRIQLLAKSGGSYTLMAETIAATGSSSWPTITLNHTVAAANAGKQLALRIISTNWNEFDNFHITSAVAGPTNNAPVFTADPLSFPTAATLVNYSGQSLAPHATDANGDTLTFVKVSGPSWLNVAANGALSGTPSSSNTGSNSFIVKVMDPTGARDYADLTIPVGDSQFYYDINGATAGSGAAAGGTWDGTAQWSASADGTAATFAWADGGTAIFSAGSDATGDYTITNTAARTLGGFVARSGTPEVTGGSLQLTAASVPFKVESASAEVVCPITGSGGMLKSDPGTLVLGGNNTFTGNISITAGVLELTTSGKLYNGAYQHNAIITIGAGATWRLPNYSYGGVGQLSDFAARRVLDGGTIEVTGTSHSSGQDFTVATDGGTFRYTPAGQTLTLAGNANTNTTIDGVLTLDAVGNVTVAGTSSILAGSGSIVKTGAGTLALSNGANSFGGALTVADGKLVANTGSVGTNSALGEKSAARFITVSGAANMDWTANNILGGGGQSAANLPTVILDGGTLTTTRYNAVGHLTLDGGSLVNSNATDPVTFDGFQFLGTITATGLAPSSITTTTNRGNHLRGGATTDFAVTDPAGRLTIATLLRNGSNDYTGAAALRKTGPGTLALTAANLFTGSTAVEAGTLELSGSVASATTVATGARLTGNGFAAAVTVQAGGVLAPNAGANLNTGALTLENGATFTADGRVSATGNLTLNGAQLVTSIGGSRVLASYTGTRIGTFAAATVPAGWQAVYDDAAKQIRLETAPAGYNAWIAGFATGGLSGFDQDANGDGIANGLVFVLGGDPTLTGSTALPVLTKVAGGFRYTFTRAARARGTTTVTAHLSDDLLTWPLVRHIPIGTTSSPGVTILNQGSYDTITIDIPGTDPRTFIRLETSVP